jgi:hypothetical protein
MLQDLLIAEVPSKGAGLNTGNARAALSERDDGLYETPPVAVHALLKHEALPRVIWEPACGPGSIVGVLCENGHRVIATDLVDYGCPDSESRIDFLFEQRAPEGCGCIVTNPPFKNAEPFIGRARELAPKTVMLLRWLSSKARSGGQSSTVATWRASMCSATACQ